MFLLLVQKKCLAKCVVEFRDKLIPEKGRAGDYSYIQAKLYITEHCWFSSKKHLPWILNVFLDLFGRISEGCSSLCVTGAHLHKEDNSLPAIQHPMIICQCKVHHLGQSVSGNPLCRWYSLVESRLSRQWRLASP